MIRSLRSLALILLAACAAPLAAQPADPPVSMPEPAVTEPPPPAAPRTMVGTWEFSNADREKTCAITFRNEFNRVGKRVEFDPACAGHFTFVKDVAAWQFSDGDFLKLLDAQGNPVLEFSEVESGIFEAPRPGEGILFIQNAVRARARAQDRRADHRRVVGGAAAPGGRSARCR